MSEDTARMIVYGIAGAMTVIWLVSLFLAKKIFQSSQDSAEETTSFQKLDHTKQVSRQMIIDGEAHVLLKRMVQQIANANISNGCFGKILGKTEDSIAFEVLPIAHRNTKNAIRALVRIVQKSPDTCEVNYTIEGQRRNIFSMMTGCFLILGFLAIIGMVAIMESAVIQNANPAVRYQTIQTIHICHFIWPAFLFIGLQRQLWTGAQNQLERLIENLPHVA